MGASAWQKTVDIMEKYNEPGKFTAFIAYEWTSNALTGENLHRNVIFRGNADKTALADAADDLGNGRSGDAVGLARQLREDHRRPRAGDPAQRQSVERPDVRRAAV